MIWKFFLAVAFVLPFFSYEIFETEFFAICAALLAPLLLCAMKTKRFLRDRAVLLSLGVWLVVVCVTSLFAISPRVSLNNAIYFLFYAVIFVLIAGFNNAQKRQLILVLVAASVVISVRGLLQYFFYYGGIIEYLSGQKGSIDSKTLVYILNTAARHRIISVFSTPNLLASYLAMVNLLTFGALIVARRKTTFFLLFAILIINSYALWFSRSLAGMASFAFGLILFLVVLFISGSRHIRGWFYLIGPFMAFVFIVAVTLFIKRTFAATGADDPVTSLQGRLEFWKVALYAIKARPLSFVGLGNFSSLYDIYTYNVGLKSTMAHNLILHLWVETGMYGVLAFATFFVTLILKSYRKILSLQDDPQGVVLRLSLLCGILASLFHNMLGFSFFIPQVATVWWILCALSVCSHNT